MVWMLLALILVPLVYGISMFIKPPFDMKSRNTGVMIVCSVISVLVIMLLIMVWRLGLNGYYKLFNIFGENFSLAFRVDGLSMVFAAIVAILWPITNLYAFEYMQHEEGQNRFFAFFTMTYGVVLGISFAANLFTMYLFYEMLTLCTLPLVMHHMDRIAKYAGLKYLLYSMGGAAMAFISMIILANHGTLAFSAGGSLFPSDVTAFRPLLLVGFLLGFFGFGVKAAIFPLHDWLPTAGVAPTPVTALLHAVAVVNAGVFAVLRLLYYGYGASFIAGTVAQNVMLAVTAFTIVFASTMALRLQHLKRRLAYSTVSNLSYILLGAALCSGAGFAAGILHMIAHSALKIALFFCAGALLCRTEETSLGVQEYVYQYTGYAKKTPVIFAVFTIASVGLIGIPPLCGFSSKWAIAQAAVLQGTPLAITGCVALAISAFLTGLYLLSVVMEGYFPPNDFDESKLAEITDPGMRMKASLWLVTAIGLGLIFFMPLLQRILASYGASLI